MTHSHWKSLAVVVVDPFARRQRAAMRAAALAQRCGARLTLLNVFMIPQPHAVQGARTGRAVIAQAMRERRAALEVIAKRLRKQGVRTRCVVRWDYPIHEGLVAMVEELEPDLLISESHRHSRLGRLLFANTDWELMRQCPCPLLLVRNVRQPRAMNVLAAVDPMHANAKPGKLDDRLLSAAHCLVQQFGGTIRIVHALQAAPSDRSLRYARDLSQGGCAELLALAARHDIPADRCDVREGEIAKVVADVAKQRRADILVMGVVSRSVAGRAVFGSSAERVIDRVDCDLLVIKPAGFRTARRRPARLPSR